MQKKLAEYKTLLEKRTAINFKIAELEDGLKAHVEANGAIEGHGVKVFKGESKSRDRKTAVMHAIEKNGAIMYTILEHTQAAKAVVKTNWTKIVNEHEIDLAPYTTTTEVIKIKVS